MFKKATKPAPIEVLPKLYADVCKNLPDEYSNYNNFKLKYG